MTTTDQWAPLKLLGCGAVSGIVTKTAVAPLERVKILYQVQDMYGTQKYSGVLGSLRTILAEDGAKGFFFGNGANIARILPAYSFKFMFNDTYKGFFRRPGQTNEQMSFFQLMGSGMLAGISQSLITYPLETVRTRLTIDSQMGGNFRGIWHCAKVTTQKEGFRALYKGLSVTFMSTPVYVGLQMSLYDVFKRNMPKNEDGSISYSYRILSGACAGLIAQTTAYPGDTIKKQMQTSGVTGNAQYRGLLHCVKSIYLRGGVRGFYPGLALNSVKCIPEAGLQFAVYDFVKELAGL